MPDEIQISYANALLQSSKSINEERDGTLTAALPAKTTEQLENLMAYIAAHGVPQTGCAFAVVIIDCD